MLERKLIGMYSAEAEELYGYATYETPDGKLVRVTGVYEESRIDEYKWKDKIIVGPVVRWISSYNRSII